jgi:hypothetical protein
MRKGILTPDQEKKLANILDEKIKLNGLLEAFDFYLFKALIQVVDDYAVDKLEDNLQLQIIEFVDLVIEGKYEEASEVAAKLSDNVIDIPGIDDEKEGVIFKETLNYLCKMLLLFIK